MHMMIAYAETANNSQHDSSTKFKLIVEYGLKLVIAAARIAVVNPNMKKKYFLCSSLAMNKSGFSM